MKNAANLNEDIKIASKSVYPMTRKNVGLKSPQIRIVSGKLVKGDQGKAKDKPQNPESKAEMELSEAENLKIDVYTHQHR